jgi:protein TIF31
MVKSFVIYKIQQHLLANMKNNQAEKEKVETKVETTQAKPIAEAPTPAVNEEGQLKEPETLTQPKLTSAHQEPEDVFLDSEEVKQLQNKYRFNLNVGMKCSLGGTQEERDRDVALVKELSAFVLDAMIPTMISEFLVPDQAPVDGDMLTECFHRKGINMRYLGKVHAACGALLFVQDLCAAEIAVRTAKHIFRYHQKYSCFESCAFAFLMIAITQVLFTFAVTQK